MARPAAAVSAPKGRKRKRTGRFSTPILPQVQSPLLRLPGEIRNKIYEYALDQTRPLHVVGRKEDEFIKLPTPVQIRRFHHLNELVRTCRQLRLETKGMGSTWAHVSWSHNVVPVPSKHVRILVQLKTNPGRIPFYRRGNGPECYSIDDGIFDDHVRLCETHPHLKVAVLSNSLRNTQGCRGILVIGAAIQLILRGKKVGFEVDAKFTSDVDRVVRAMAGPEGFGTFEQGFRYPKNLSYFPQDIYNENELRSTQPRKKKGFEEWVAQIREWYEHGI
ncbi:hypothetical protein G6011_02532 [Alternaria panax]|uniref:Uncharacterized protein n=1 Tax=Alternaria panax TaxID=48097 RepID=A0AAD4FAD6_9PLEO|nr:hypothetical protein G6011_02532 [Alternaria panax]